MSFDFGNNWTGNVGLIQLGRTFYCKEIFNYIWRYIYNVSSFAIFVIVLVVNIPAQAMSDINVSQSRAAGMANYIVSSSLLT